MNILPVFIKLITWRIRSYRPFFRNALEVLGRVVGVRVEPQGRQRSPVIDDAWVHGQTRDQLAGGPRRSKHWRRRSTDGRQQRQRINRSQELMMPGRLLMTGHGRTDWARRGLQQNKTKRALFQLNW